MQHCVVLRAQYERGVNLHGLSSRNGDVWEEAFTIGEDTKVWRWASFMCWNLE